MSEQAPIPLPTCPIAETCKGMMEKSFSGFALIVPGVVFITLGVLTIIEPLILAWVMATAFIFFGVTMLMMANFIRKVGKRLRNVRRPAT